MSLQEYLEWGGKKWGRRLIPLWLEILDYKTPRPAEQEDEAADSHWFKENWRLLQELFG